MNDKHIQEVMEKNIRLERIVKVLIDLPSDKVLRQIVSPFADDTGSVMGCHSGEESFDWYEQHIFNESRLYHALGKDEARSVLGVWRRFRQVCELLILEGK